MAEDYEKAVWNIDDEILKIIKEMKMAFLSNMKEWKLDDAYWIIILICTECDAKLKEKERTDIEKDLKNLEQKRQLVLKEGNKEGEFYMNLIKTYKKINHLMKEHGVWFREMEDDVGL